MRRFLLLLAAAGCATAAPPAAPARVAWPPPACPDTSPADCRVRLEEVALAAAAGRVSRSGGTLTIRGTEGPMLALENRTTPEDETRVHRYARFLPEIGFHLVEVGYYEGGSWLLVDARTTDQTPLLGPPVVSPGRKRFATASLDLLAGYDPNGVEVWRLDAGAPRLEYGVAGGDQWGATDLAWRGDDTLDFTRHDRSSSPDPDLTLQRRMRLTIRGPALTLLPLAR